MNMPLKFDIRVVFGNRCADFGDKRVDDNNVQLVSHLNPRSFRLEPYTLPLVPFLLICRHYGHFQESFCQVGIIRQLLSFWTISDAGGNLRAGIPVNHTPVFVETRH